MFRKEKHQVPEEPQQTTEENEESQQTMVETEEPQQTTPEESQETPSEWPKEEQPEEPQQTPTETEESQYLFREGVRCTVWLPPVISPQTSTLFEIICRNNSVRHLAGTLDNCNLIDNNFRIGYDVKIVLIPEPSNLNN